MEIREVVPTVKLSQSCGLPFVCLFYAYLENKKKDSKNTSSIEPLGHVYVFPTLYKSTNVDLKALLAA